MSKMVRVDCLALSTSRNWKNLEIKVEGKRSTWIPYSLIDETIRDKGGITCAVMIPEWLAIKNKLIS